MPTYEYRCSAGHHFEQLQRMSEPPIERCPTCGAPAQRQLSGGVGVLFKGSGFYITDYRSDSYRKAAEAEQGGTKPAAEKSGSEKSGSEKSGSEKSGSEKSASEKSGSEKPASARPKGGDSGGTSATGKAE
jgi:putative FmdB family regulatory protein